MLKQIETDPVRLRALEYVADKLRREKGNPAITAESLNTHLDMLGYRSEVEELTGLIKAAVADDRKAWML